MLCLFCRGNHRSVDCPRFLKLPINRVSGDFSGSSPPAIFVGKANYPQVSAGLLAPPEVTGDTTDLDDPSGWFSKRLSISEVVERRVSLLNSTFTINVKKPNRVVDAFRELALAARPAETEVSIERTHPNLQFSTFVTPMGPRAKLKHAKVTENISVPKRVDSVVNDDLKANEAVDILYSHGTDYYYIQRLLSAGLLGVNKKLVPTRWSITATDDIIGKQLIEEVKDHNPVNSYQIFYSEYLDNQFHVLLVPANWSYEIIEAFGSNTSQDWENYYGRKDYADNVAGGYYAARLAVLEHLQREHRQATVIIVRTIGAGYSVPLGVWQVRENVRNAMKQKPLDFPTLEQALTHLANHSRLKLTKLLEVSELLDFLRKQKRLADF